ncbi:MAG TPA: YceI family protein [Gemmataceae bacterium]|nr:YceI family protein [Gemmataceae bacterium]
MRNVFVTLILAASLAVPGCTGGNGSGSSGKTSPTTTDGSGKPKDDSTHVITGDLTLHGTTKSISFPAKVTGTEDALTLNGTFTIDRTDFGINFNPAQVNKEVMIKVSVKVGRKGADAGAITPENTKIDFIGSKKEGMHDGGFKAFSGSIKPMDTDVTKSTITVEIDTDSIWTDDDEKTKKLTTHLKGPDFFDVKKHPKASFVSKEIKAAK